MPNLAADACAGAEEMDPPLGPSVDELAEGLAAQPFTDASAITDVTLSGYAGKHVEYSFEGGDGDCARLARFSNVLGTREAIINEHDEVWILDVEGQRIMIDAFWFSDVTDAELPRITELHRGLLQGPSSPAAGGSRMLDRRRPIINEHARLDASMLDGDGIISTPSGSATSGCGAEELRGIVEAIEINP